MPATLSSRGFELGMHCFRIFERGCPEQATSSVRSRGRKLVTFKKLLCELPFSGVNSKHAASSIREREIRVRLERNRSSEICSAIKMDRRPYVVPTTEVRLASRVMRRPSAGNSRFREMISSLKRLSTDQHYRARVYGMAERGLSSKPCARKIRASSICALAKHSPRMLQLLSIRPTVRLCSGLQCLLFHYSSIPYFRGNQIKYEGPTKSGSGYTFLLPSVQRVFKSNLSMGY